MRSLYTGGNPQWDSLDLQCQLMSCYQELTATGYKIGYAVAVRSDSLTLWPWVPIARTHQCLLRDFVMARNSCLNLCPPMVMVIENPTHKPQGYHSTSSYAWDQNHLTKFSY